MKFESGGSSLVVLATYLLGAAAFVVASSVDYHVWRRLAPVLFVIAVIGLLLVLIPGVGITVDGSRRWLGAGAFRVQPSELAKLALLCCGANVLKATSPASASGSARDRARSVHGRPADRATHLGAARRGLTARRAGAAHG